MKTAKNNGKNCRKRAKEEIGEFIRVSPYMNESETFLVS